MCVQQLWGLVILSVTAEVGAGRRMVPWPYPTLPHSQCTCTTPGCTPLLLPPDHRRLHHCLGVR